MTSFSGPSWPLDHFSILLIYRSLPAQAPCHCLSAANRQLLSPSLSCAAAWRPSRSFSSDAMPLFLTQSSHPCLLECLSSHGSLIPSLSSPLSRKATGPLHLCSMDALH